jgi:hypothetical protein
MSIRCALRRSRPGAVRLIAETSAGDFNYARNGTSKLAAAMAPDQAP